MATARTQGRKYPRRDKWETARDEAYARAGHKCEISGESLSSRACDHLWPERWIRKWCKGANPHIAENLFVITSALHAKKTAVEIHIYKADVLRYKQELIRLGWDATQIDRALAAIVRSVPGERPNGKPHTPASAPAA